MHTDRLFTVCYLPLAFFTLVLVTALHSHSRTRVRVLTSFSAFFLAVLAVPLVPPSLACALPRSDVGLPLDLQTVSTSGFACTFDLCCGFDSVWHAPAMAAAANCLCGLICRFAFDYRGVLGLKRYPAATSSEA